MATQSTNSINAKFAVLLLSTVLVAATSVKAKVSWKRATPAHDSRRRPWDVLQQVVYHNRPVVHALGALGVARLDYYVQVSGSDLQVLLPAIDPPTLYEFGQTQIFMLNVTEAEDPTSTQLGYVRGFTMQASYTSVGADVAVEVLEYNDGTFNGTVSLQGLVFSGTAMVSVVGGTGDFVGVKGYGNITLVTRSDSRDVYHHNLYFV